MKINRKVILFLMGFIIALGVIGFTKVQAASYSEHSLDVRYQNIRLAGHLYVPRHHGKRMPAVIVSHGLGRDYIEVAPYARSLARRGYLTYAYDFAGGGNGASEGRTTRQMSVFTEQKDLTAVLNNIRHRKDVDPKRVSLVGASQGGLVSALMASQHPGKVHSLALLYPAFSASDEVQRRYSSINQVPRVVDWYGVEVGRPYFRRLLHTNVLNEATKYNGPTLIIHGSDDSIIPVRYAHAAARRFPNAQLRIINGAEHGFPGSAQRRATRILDQFFEQHE